MRAHILVGLPGVGKSTLVRELRTLSTFVYSTDAKIEEIAQRNNKTYDEMFEQAISTAKKEMDYELRLAKKAEVDIIWDQTNLSSKKRKSIVQSLGSYICICHYVKMTNEEVWKQRLNSRPGKTIPSNILQSMCSNLQEPTLAEGFQIIYTYDMNLQKRN